MSEVEVKNVVKSIVLHEPLMNVHGDKFFYATYCNFSKFLERRTRCVRHSTNTEEFLGLIFC